MLWRLRAFPDFCEPCLPSAVERPPAGSDWIHEIKHDGFRLLARRGASGGRLFTRNGHDWTDPLFKMSVVGSASQHVRMDNAFSRRAGHASISALDVRTGRLQWGTAVHWRASQDSVHAGSIAAASAATKIGRMPLTRGSLTSPSTPSDLMTLILEARPFSVLLRTVFYRESYREA